MRRHIGKLQGETRNSRAQLPPSLTAGPHTAHLAQDVVAWVKFLRTRLLINFSVFGTTTFAYYGSAVGSFPFPAASAQFAAASGISAQYSGQQLSEPSTSSPRVPVVRVVRARMAQPHDDTGRDQDDEPQGTTTTLRSFGHPRVSGQGLKAMYEAFLGYPDSNQPSAPDSRVYANVVPEGSELSPPYESARVQ
ncbi:uncharacterized protein EI90DRAFT_3152431 [Cantharellus anzutake]|uniref:uncharacterized protein n=1 Tax=Cantharellus anzutake TaxID=1750568 RepID=UPI00190527C1|nr:uncharacterized protein EI90DRAFT_3152431 [Cantharellus anzutake]KAF8337043.1 hypothetical protein EI90DRAFT_3152431 [Cantharellus anzutake]